MNKRDKVIKGLECCTTMDEQGFPSCEKCPYDVNGTCHDLDALHRDALMLLKAQKAEAADVPKPDSDIGCWYDITHNYTLEQVVSALKAQEPRIMTLKEVQQHNNQDGCIWFEQPSYNAVAAFVTQDGEEFTELISPYLLGLPINHIYMANRFYGLTWRCWTPRPTDEQREAAQWQ